MLALPLAAVSLADTLARVVVGVDPDRAHALAPWNGVVTAKLAEREFRVSPSVGPNDRPHQLAERALRQDATAVGALNVIGMAAQARNDSAGAEAAFAHALVLSRRELVARIWAIEEAVGRGDIRQALANYDIALKTSRSAADLLFPVLGSAIVEPRIRAELLRILRSDPVWEEALVNYLATAGKQPSAVAALFREGGATLPIDEDDRVNLVNGLFAKDEVAGAWSYYRTFRSGAERDRSRDPGFSAPIVTRTRFDWNIADTPGISASFQTAGEHGLLGFSVAAGASGLVVEQAQYLPAGRYRFATQVDAADSEAKFNAATTPYWKLTCSNGTELARLPVPVRAYAEVLFTVAPDCAWQSLQLVARSSTMPTGVKGQILLAAITPAKSSGA